MADGEKESTPLEQTVARLLDSRGVEIAKDGGSGQFTGWPAPRAPAAEHLDFSHPAAEETAQEAPEAFWEQPVEPIRRGFFAPRPGISSARQKRMAILVPVLCVILLVVLNKYHGVRVFGSEWLKLKTYRTIISDLLESASSATKDGTGQAARPKVRGIAYSEDKPSAIIESTIVHEGDLVSGATVVKISKDRVEFEVNGQRWTQKVQ